MNTREWKRRRRNAPCQTPAQFGGRAAVPSLVVGLTYGLAAARWAARKHPWPAKGRQERFYKPLTEQQRNLAAFWAYHRGEA